MVAWQRPAMLVQAAPFRYVVSGYYSLFKTFPYDASNRIKLVTLIVAQCTPTTPPISALANPMAMIMFKWDCWGIADYWTCWPA